MIGCHKKGIISYKHYCMILLGKKQKYSYKPIRTLQVYLCKQIFYVSFFHVPMCFSFRPVFTTSMTTSILSAPCRHALAKTWSWQKLTYGAPYPYGAPYYLFLSVQKIAGGKARRPNELRAKVKLRHTTHDTRHAYIRTLLCRSTMTYTVWIRVQHTVRLVSTWPLLNC